MSSLSLTFHERLRLRQEVAKEQRVVPPARYRVVALDRRDEVARDELRALRIGVKIRCCCRALTVSIARN